MTVSMSTVSGLACIARDTCFTIASTMLLLSECVTDGRGIIVAIVEHVSRVTHVKPKTVYMGTLITQRQRQWLGFCQIRIVTEQYTDKYISS